MKLKIVNGEYYIYVDERPQLGQMFIFIDGEHQRHGPLECVNYQDDYNKNGAKYARRIIASSRYIKGLPTISKLQAIKFSIADKEAEEKFNSANLKATVKEKAMFIKGYTACFMKHQGLIKSEWDVELEMVTVTEVPNKLAEYVHTSADGTKSVLKLTNLGSVTITKLS